MKDPDTMLRDVRKLYLEATESNKPATVHDLVERLRAAVGAHNAGPVMHAYLGSALVLESSGAHAPWTKGRLAKEGLEFLDRAVESAPDNWEVRFLRAASTYHLPRVFRRRDQCREDLKRLNSNLAGSAPDERLTAAALHFHGNLQQEANDLAGARAAWTRAATLSPTTRAGRESARHLKETSRN